MALEAAESDRAQADGKPGSLELEAAKEILAEVFHARPGEVEEMIKRRLVESGPAENIWPEERGEKLWPANFCLSD